MTFVGRERELSRLAAGLDRAAAGQPSRLVLTGPAGIGVSSLLDELGRRLADLPHVALARGAAYEPCAGVPYHALVEALGGALGGLTDARLLEVVGPAGHDLGLLLPGLRDRLAGLGALPEAPLLSAPNQRGARMTEAIIGMLERLAGGGVVLLALEDIHAADPGTREFVASLLRIRRRLPLCLVVSYRPDEVHRRHPARDLVLALAHAAAVEHVPVPPLHRAELVQLLEARMGERPAGSFVAAVVEGSGGVPLLAGQLALAHESVEGVRLSEGFEELLQARLSTLSVAATRCLRVLAAARRPLPRALLGAIELPDGKVTRTALREALESGLALAFGADGRVSGASGGASEVGSTGAAEAAADPDAPIGIAHERYAEAIEALTLPRARQAVHAALAAALADRPAEAAWHWEAALRLVEARDAHLAAGEAAEIIEPGGTALLHHARALELADVPSLGNDATGSARSAEVPEILARAAQAAFVAGSFRRAAGLVQRAIDEVSSGIAVRAMSSRGARARRDLQLRVGTLYERLGRHYWAGGDLVPALAAFETAVQLVPEEPIVERARVLGSLSQHLMLDGRFAESAVLAQQAIEVARAVGDAARAERAQATCTLGVDVAYAGDVDRGLALVEESGELARQAGDLDVLMRAYANRTTLLDLDARREDALAVVSEGIAEARRWGLEGVYGAFLRGNAADCLFNLGRWAESESECRAALEWSPSGVFFYNPVMYLSMMLVESRSDEEASSMVGQLLLHLETVPEGQWSASVQRTAVSFALWRDDPLEALRVARDGWKRVLETEDWLQAAVAASTTLEACSAAVEHARGHRDFAGVADATGLAREVLPEAERRVAASEVPARLGARREAELHLGMARGHMARIRGRRDPRTWARLAEAWNAAPVPYLAAKCRWWQAADALHLREKRGGARDALLEAWRIASALPARPLLRELERLARRARIALPGEPVAVMEDRARPAAAGGPAAGVPGAGMLAVGLRAAGVPSAAAGSRSTTAFADPGEEGYQEVATDGVPVFDPDLLPGRAAPSRSPEETLAAIVGAGAGAGAVGGEAPISPAAIVDHVLQQHAAAVADPFGLSPRESEVLAILAEGRTNREIAERLFISDRTVAVHVRNILAKLGVSGRVEATSVAIRLGLVPGFSDGPAARLSR